MFTPHFLGRRFVLILVSFLAVSSFAADNHFRLFDHSDRDSKRGFYLSLESEANDGRLTLDLVRLRLTIGDGFAWRHIDVARIFQANEKVHLRAVLHPAGAQLHVDGQLIGESAGAFATKETPTATVAETLRWSKAQTWYRVRQGSWSLSVDGQRVSGIVRRGVGGQLELFEFPLGQEVEIPAITGQSEVELVTEFHIDLVTPEDLAGAVDRYGQASAAEWPGKVRRDDDLQHARDEEFERSRDWHRPTDWDRYGGLTTAPWREKPTGFYRVTKRGETWWLVSPEGHPLFYTGVCVAPALVWTVTPTQGREHIFSELPPRSGATADLWEDDTWGNGEPALFSFGGWNLLRKFGRDWKRLAIEDCARRLDAWGFSGLGKFCDREDVPGKPRVETLKLGRKVKPLVRHIDVFDSAARAEFLAQLEPLVRPWRDDPRVLGFSVNNEFEEIFTTAEIRSVLEQHPDSAAAKAMTAAMAFSDPATDEQIEQARQLYAKAYYAFVYRTMKELAPNHLYFGFWITPGWWENESDWDMIVPYCDVLGYDKYSIEYGGDDGLVHRLIAKFDKPTIVGEFSHAPWYGGERGFSRYSTFVETDRDSADGYESYVRAAAADPRCVGAMWFQYRDVPITGWGGEGDPGSLVRGESYAQGLVDITDRPKWEVVERVRQTNLRLTRDRLAK